MLYSSRSQPMSLTLALWYFSSMCSVSTFSALVRWTRWPAGPQLIPFVQGGRERRLNPMVASSALVLCAFPRSSALTTGIRTRAASTSYTLLVDLTRLLIPAPASILSSRGKGKEARGNRRGCEALFVRTCEPVKKSEGDIRSRCLSYLIQTPYPPNTKKISPHPQPLLTKLFS